MAASDTSIPIQSAADPVREGRRSTPTSPKRILIIRPSALGDVSRTVPVLATLRRAYPDATIDWLVAQSFADVIRHHPMLDHIVTYDRTWLSRVARGKGTVRGGLKWARQLRHADYDLVYDLQGLLRSGFFTRLTGARRRVGFAHAREGAWLGYNVRHDVGRNGRYRHTVDHMLGLLEADGLEPVRDMRLYVGEEDRQWLTDFEGRHHLCHGQYVCLAPTARWASKCWPIDRYTEIARRLLSEGLPGRKEAHAQACLAEEGDAHAEGETREVSDSPPPLLRGRLGGGRKRENWPSPNPSLRREGGISEPTHAEACPAEGEAIVIIASPAERALVQPMLDALADHGDRIVMPETSVGRMMALLSGARLLVCNDSAPLHIAVGFDRPVVAIFGPTDPARVGPYGRLDSVVRPAEANGRRFNYRRHRHDQSLIAQVEVETVWEKIVNLDLTPRVG